LRIGADPDRKPGGVAHSFRADGGLAALTGNRATDGAIVKTAGVDPTALVFAGFAFQSCMISGISAVASMSRVAPPGSISVKSAVGPPPLTSTSDRCVFASSSNASPTSRPGRSKRTAW
jgi:hypothetical protein